MPNDDGLKEFMACQPDGLLRRWLSELLTAREYIPALQAEAERAKQLQEKITAMEHGMKFYIDRTTKLIDKAESLERTIECWVTRARMLEAKLSEVRESEEYLTARIVGIVSALRDKDELLWWLTALGWRDFTRKGGIPLTIWGDEIRQMLATQGYMREALEKRNG